MNTIDVLTKEQWDALPLRAVVVNRRTKFVTVYQRVGRDWPVVRKIRCATGMPAYGTPGGLFSVKSKAKWPDWQMPHSVWVPKELQGTVIPGGVPANPIKGAFLKLTDDGIGIHGTGDVLSLGKRASHGCIRVSERDALWLYKHVPVGSTVYVR